VTPERDIRDDLEPGIGDDVVALAERLRDSRPLPNPVFRGELRRRLMGRPRGRFDAIGVRARIAACSVSGTLLLVIGAVGAAGH
jgi:hypothetical protein